MALRMFKRPYVVRRHQAQTISEGYASAPSELMTLMLDVQPLSADDMQALDEGERVVKRLKSYGATEMVAADGAAGIPGDHLLYQGKWYECVSCVRWDHTFLRHHEAQYTLMARQPRMPEDNP